MMTKSDVTNLYSMEDLLPVVGKLAEEYTAKESSSVTYERARQLMDAVIYCIAHLENGNHVIVSAKMPTAAEAYQLGFHAVMEKVKVTLEKYNTLMIHFDSYNNRNYDDTVKKALPGFFMYYDAKFAPMENIITMDYPVFGLDMNLEGIDMISQYIDAIWEEQCYLKQFPREQILRILRLFHPHYQKEYFNIREIVELHIRNEKQ